MALGLKVSFTCDDGRVCTSGGIQAIRTREMTIQISPHIEQLAQALAQLPGGWKRDDKGSLSCDSCSKGAISLHSVG
jgi:hypothetical protein